MDTLIDSTQSRNWLTLNQGQKTLFQNLKKFQPLIIKISIGIVVLVTLILGLVLLFGIGQGLRLRITNNGLQWQISSKNSILTPNKELVNTLQDNYNQAIQDRETLTKNLATETEKLNQTTKNLESKSQEYAQLTEDNNKTKADLEAKAKEIDQKNKDLESKVNEVNGLNTTKNNLQNQKILLEKQKKDLEKTIASGNFNQAKIPNPVKGVTPTKSFVPPAPSNTSRTVTVIYFWFRTGVDQGALCSGELDKSRTVITTVTHCQDRAPKTDDRVIYRNMPVDSNDIFPVYTADINLSFGDTNYKIVSVDKGVVNAKYNPFENPHCYQGSNICNDILVKATSTLGQGNSGSTVYDPSGRFVGVLSGGYDSISCPVINVGNLPPQSGKRGCSKDIIIALDSSYASFMRG